MNWKFITLDQACCHLLDLDFSFCCDRRSWSTNIHLTLSILPNLIKLAYKKHVYSKSLIRRRRSRQYFVLFNILGPICQWRSVGSGCERQAGDREQSGPGIIPACLMVWSSVRYPANVRRWPSILDPWQSPWHPTLVLWWCHAPQRTDSNAIWEEFQLSFLAIAPPGALYSLLVLCPEPRPRIGIIFNLHTENVRSYF